MSCLMTVPILASLFTFVKWYLKKYIPNLESVSIVPVGLSKFREGLYELEPFTKEDAIATIELVSKFRDEIYKEHGIHFAHLSDEWFLLAQKPLPKEDAYDGYPQYENGVGMLRLLIDEFMEALDAKSGDERNRRLSIATGRLAGPTIEYLADKMNEKFPNVKVNIYPIRNDFFGPMITVSGLLTGQDIIAQLKGKELGDKLMLPINVLRFN